MASNCFVTKLKGAVDNDSLLKIGEMRCSIKLNSYNIPRTVVETVSSKVYITLLDNGVTFNTATGEHQIIDSKHAILSNNYVPGAVLSVSGAQENGKINVVISNKYEVVSTKTDLDGVNLGDLSFSTGLTDLRLMHTNGTSRGNLSDLSALTSLTYINLQDIDMITGDVNSLGALTSLENINLATDTKQFTGTWDEFVSSQRGNGRTTCSGINILVAHSTIIPFGSKPNTKAGSAGESAVLKWDSSKFSLQWDTSKIAWTIGYSASDIAEKTGTGGDWEGYTVTTCDPE